MALATKFGAIGQIQPLLRRLSGATSISARSRSIPLATAAATCSGVRIFTPGGRSSPVSAHMPASLMKPGKTVVAPTPVPLRSSRNPKANARTPNLVAE